MNTTNQNIWPHVVVTGLILAFCAFLVWRSPTSLNTIMLLVGGVSGWWIPAPGSSGSTVAGNLLASLLPAQPIQPVVPKEQA